MSDYGSLVGKIVGNYEVLAELGRGGMGVVLKAHEMSLQRVVALKILPAHLAADPAFVQRFMREARASAKLSHPNIVTIHAVGEHNGIHFMAMEYVKGKTLATLIQEAGQYEVRPALKITTQIAEALSEAHSKDIIHRDIKPANIMIDQSGRAKVMDFGLAKVLTAATHLTAEGASLGTPLYMSPEQCQGAAIDPRTDLYSLGVTLFEMLSGSPPFTADTPLALMNQITTFPFPSVRDLNSKVPPEVDYIISKLVARSPAQRYSSADALVADINAWMRSGLTPSPSEGEGPILAGDTPGLYNDKTVPVASVPPVPPKKHRSALKRAIAALVLIPVIVVVAFLMRGTVPATPKTTSPPRPQVTESATQSGTEANKTQPLISKATQGPQTASPATEPAPSVSRATEAAPIAVAKQLITGVAKEYLGGRFTDRGDGTVLDTDTFLIWQKGHSEELFLAPEAKRTTDYRAYANELDLIGRAWRIPTKAEFMSLQLDEFEGEEPPFVNVAAALFWCMGTGRDRIYWVFDWNASTFSIASSDPGDRYRVRCVAGP